jgi:polar amino acid transport system substrate-binding protein
MINIYKLFLFFIFVTYLKAGEINFTPQETQFIEQNPNITIAFMGDYTPMSYVENNKFTGYSNDLLILLEKKTGLKFEKQIDAWTNNLAKFNNRQVDVIADISYKKERENTTLFTKSYLEVPTVIFVRSDFKEYNGLQSLKGKRIGIQQDVFYEQELRNLGFDIVEFTNYEEQTKALSYGKIDVLIENLATIDYIIKQNNLVNITPVDELEINGIGKEDLRYGIVPNKPILHSIIQKGLDSITDYEKNSLINKWIGIDFYKINQNKVHLTDEEMEYLDSNTISIAFLSDFAPFSFYENQIIKGYTVDLFNLISNKLNIKFTKVIGKWSDNLNKFKNNHIDVITDISYIKERENFTAFTTPYFEVPSVIFTRDDFGTYHDLESL